MSRLEEEMQKSRVVVTGMGAITPIGLTVEEFWENVKAQKVGIGAITKFDTTDFKVKLAAEVKGFDAQAYMDFKQAKRMELFSQYAVAAAGQAIKDAGLDMEKEDAYRVGTSIGSGIGSLDAMEREHKKLLERGPGRIRSTVSSAYDYQYGGRKCIHCIRIKRKKHQCGNSLCDRNKFYRGGIPLYPVR